MMRMTEHPRKYELTDETKTIEHAGKTITLHRIRALIRIDLRVVPGRIGGWVQNESNLSQTGSSFVFDDACVFGCGRVMDDARIYNDVQVFGHARVRGGSRIYDQARIYDQVVVKNVYAYDNAEIFGNAFVNCDGLVISRDGVIKSDRDFMLVKSVGSEDGTLIVHRTKTGILVTRGCFTGTLDEFRQAVVKRHGDNVHAQIYESLLRAIELRFDVKKEATGDVVSTTNEA